jgi:hypothetical protein
MGSARYATITREKITEISVVVEPDRLQQLDLAVLEDSRIRVCWSRGAELQPIPLAGVDVGTPHLGQLDMEKELTRELGKC